MAFLSTETLPGVRWLLSVDPNLNVTPSERGIAVVQLRREIPPLRGDYF